MSQKKYYIDDFKVRNCTQYGQYEIIDKLISGNDVIIEYDEEEKAITVKGHVNDKETKAVNNQEKASENNQEKGSENKWETFGELEVPEQMRKILVPLLQGIYGSDAFICKINIADKKVVINERLQVSVWAANKEAKKTEDDKKKVEKKSQVQI